MLRQPPDALRATWSRLEARGYSRVIHDREYMYDDKVRDMQKEGLILRFGVVDMIKEGWFTVAIGGDGEYLRYAPQTWARYLTGEILPVQRSPEELLELLWRYLPAIEAAWTGTAEQHAELWAISKSRK